MNKTKIPEPDPDNLLKQTLKDDLSPEAEARMRRQFLNLKRMLDRPEDVAERDTRTRRHVLNWPNSWLRACWAFRQEILAFASAVMLILGTVMQLGGGQSALAESIGRLKVMITVSEGLYRATSMDCTVMKPGAERESIQYRVR
jgi:hypothetical protein